MEDQIGVKAFGASGGPLKKQRTCLPRPKFIA